MNGRITLLTDFGDQDGYVGAMKGVIATHAPNAHIVDIGHHIPAGHIRQASFVLWSASRYWPAGTTHLAVVDPTVGSERRAVAVAVDDQVYFAPDNGLLSDVLAATDMPVNAIELDNDAFWHHPVSPTFHGRDIFASCASYLVAGVPLIALGSTVDPDSLVKLPTPRLEGGGGKVIGEIVSVDRFGNAITNVTADIVAKAGEGLVVGVGETVISGVSQVFADVPEGQPLIYVGSSGRLEIAVNGGSAAQRFSLAVGGSITLGRG
jgi:S-adenosylmethionine hydrolase